MSKSKPLSVKKAANYGAARLIVADSESHADLLYATRFFVPDPIIWFEADGKGHGVFNALEIDRAKREASIDIFLSYEEEAKLTGRGKKATFSDVMGSVLFRHGVKKVEVPVDFPVGHARTLEKLGIRVKVAKGLFFPQREVKSETEIEGIIRGQRQAEAGMKRAVQVLKEASVGTRGRLMWNKKALTSEILRGEIDAAVVRAGGIPANTIAAGGVQSCDPHERGSGPLFASQTIIVDIFPRDQVTGYFGDLTRTFVKGPATPEVKKLYRTVLEGQKLALKAMRVGADGMKIHESVKDYFTEKGFPTEQRDGRWVGFFHGTGHSLGLEIHEAPRFAAGNFKEGHIMTVEPGIYDPAIGGVRIEDLVVVTKTGVRNLTKVPKEPRFFEIA